MKKMNQVNHTKDNVQKAVDSYLERIHDDPVNIDLQEVEVQIARMELDEEYKVREFIKYFDRNIGEMKLKEFLRNMHAEHYKSLLRMREKYLMDNDHLRSKGVSFNERQERLGKGKLHWLDERLKLVIKAGKELKIPRMIDWVKAGDLERMFNDGLQSWLEYYYRLGIFLQ